MNDTTKVTVEFRPRICSCQFFITSPHLSSNNIDITVEEHKVILESCSKYLCIVLGDSINLTQNSVSGLQFAYNSLYFRCRTYPDKVYGSFNTEIIFTSNSSFSSNTSITDSFSPNMQPNKFSSFFCRSCSTPILQSPVFFRRILKLPISTDISSFFCHFSHDTASSSAEKLDNLFLKESDCFYGQYFIALNRILLLDKKSSEPKSIVCGNTGQTEVLNCAKCSSWLGTIEEPYIKLWNSSTIIRCLDEDIAVQDPLKCKTRDDSDHVALTDFISIIKHSVNERSSLGIPAKLIVTCRVDSTEINYLLIWIMDKNLALLVEDNDCLPSSPTGEQPLGHTTKSVSTLILKSKRVMKCLYYFSKSMTAMVEKWNKLPETSTIEVSKQMLTQGLLHLEDLSYNIPQEFRTASEMNVTYIMN